MSFFEGFSLGIVHDVVNQRVHVLFRQCRMVEFLEIAVDTNQRRFSGAQMAIACTLIHPKDQKLGNIHKPSTPDFL